MTILAKSVEKISTVGELRKTLADYPDYMKIDFGDGHLSLRHIEKKNEHSLSVKFKEAFVVVCEIDCL